NHSSAPRAHNPAATENGMLQPKYLAITGVNCAVSAPPIWLPMFITPETDPADAPAISELTDQNELCERYSAPAPPARTILARRASLAWLPMARNTALNSMPADATPHRPARLPTVRVSLSLIQPPHKEPIAMAKNGSME